MIGNIWLSSALIVTAIFSASALYKSYSDIQEAKQIQEHYEIISDIKTIIAKQYNKNPDEITRDEIIAHLPRAGNWEKVLLLDRNESSTLSADSLVNKDGDIEISEEDNLKLLVLKAKLKNITDISTLEPTDGKYTFEVGKTEKNSVLNDSELEKSIDRAIHFFAVELLYSTPTTTLDTAFVTKIIKEFTPYDNMYQDFRDAGQIASDTILSDEEKDAKKEDYFKLKIKEKLEKNDTAIETRLYTLLKDEL